MQAADAFSVRAFFSVIGKMLIQKTVLLKAVV